MTTIDEIMGAVGRHGDDCIRDGDAASKSFDGLREMIAAELADARREGAEAMREAVALQWEDCGYDVPGETVDIGAAIRALPLPTGPRQVVLLTDEQIARAYREALGVEYLPPTDEDADKEAYSALMRVGGAIQALVLAANGLEARRG